MNDPTTDKPAPATDEKGPLRELSAIRTCARQLDSLDPAGRRRALEWINGAYWVEAAYNENGENQ